METIGKIVVGTLLFCLLISLIAVLIALPVMWLWNWLIPVVFPCSPEHPAFIVQHIGFWQALGISLLCSFLFKSSSSSSKSKD